MAEKHLIDSSLFEGVDPQYAEDFITTVATEMHVKAEDVLCRQNDIADSMYLLKNGKLGILIEHMNIGSPEKHGVIAVIETGTVIGELCVFGQKKRSATIKALEDSIVLNIEGEQFRQRIQAREIGALLMSYNIAKLLSQRLVSANEFIRKLYEEIDHGGVRSELESYRKRFFDESLFN